MEKKGVPEIRISLKMGKWQSLGLKLSSVLTFGSNDRTAVVKSGKQPWIPVLTPLHQTGLVKVRNKQDKQEPYNRGT